MGSVYKIRCKHCGAQFNLSNHANYGFLPISIGYGKSAGDIETQSAMRCPACLKRLNNTAEEFNEQVKVTHSWD